MKMKTLNIGADNSTVMSDAIADYVCGIEGVEYIEGVVVAPDKKVGNILYIKLV